MTAMALAVAVIAIAAARATPSPAAPTRALAAELLIARGDLARLDNEPDLPRANRDGLMQRIKGALGLLPFLLRQAGDPAEAERLRLWQQHAFSGKVERAALMAELDAAIARFPLDLDAFLKPSPNPARLSEARAIHETYCAGCHDGAGKGSADTLLPARDLFQMARDENADEFLARMVNGVKGDAGVKFANPLTDAQIGALRNYYRGKMP